MEPTPGKHGSFRWSKCARDLVNTNLSTTEAEFRDLITKLVEATGNPRDACLRFALWNLTPGKRRSFRWSKCARDLVNTNLNASGAQFRELITKLVEATGNPRDACLRFARQLGMCSKRQYRHWNEKEQQELEHWMSLYPVKTAALKLRRPASAVYGMVRRMGLTGRVSKEGMTMYALAAALDTRTQTIRNWIAAGLVYHTEGTEKVPRIIINPDDFARFYKTNPKRVVGNRIMRDRVEFVMKYIFPPSHMELLPVREAKKERLAYQAQMFEDEIEDDTDDQNPDALIN